MAKLYNLARMTTATTGTGTITLGAAVAGFLSFAAAGVANGDVVAYGIKDGNNSEVGTGTYTSSGTTLTRTVLKSTNSDTAISLSGSAEIFITALKEQIGNLTENNIWAGIQQFDGQMIAKGTATNDNAAAGYIGEIIESEVLSGAAVTLTSAASNNITSISLTAGDWDVWGLVVLGPSGTTTIQSSFTFVHNVSAGFPTAPNKGSYTGLQVQPAVGMAYSLPTGPRRYSFASTTTVYIIVYANFTGGTCLGYGYIGARRVR